MDQPYDAEQVAGEFQRSRRFITKWRIVVGDKRTDAAHVRQKLFNEFQVSGQMSGHLIRRPYHKTTAHLISNVPQVLQALHTVFKRHF